jgi:hypothetical protein
MSASRRVLHENHTAEVTVRVSRLDRIPDTAWKADASEQSGKLFLTIRNDSPDVVTMEGASGDKMIVTLGRDDIRDGAFERKITVRALKAGTFALEANVDSGLAKLPGNERPIQLAKAVETAAPAPEPRHGGKHNPRNRSKEPGGESTLEEGETPEGGTIIEGGGGIPVGLASPTPMAPKNPSPPIPLHWTPEQPQDCPERGMGCAALIIDLIQVDQDDNEDAKKDRLEEKKVIEDLAKNLKGAKCDVDEIVAKFEKVDDHVEVKIAKRETINGRANRPIIHVHVKPGDSENTKDAEKHNLDAEKHNVEEWKKIKAKIEDHRKKVRLGKELAIEVVNGHGSQGAPDRKSTCGNWGPGLEHGYYTPQEDSLTNPKGPSTDYEEPLFALWRDEFHEGNYQAADGTVCDWVVYDMSCYSGLTPMAIDELENHGDSSNLTCAQPSIVDCSLHAGWEFEFASGTSVCAETVKAFQDLEALKDLDKVVDGATSVKKLAARLQKASRETQRIHENLKEAKILEGNSFYSDKGYRKDPDPYPPPPHPHTGY